MSESNNKQQEQENTPCRDSMVWYRSFFDAIERLKDEQRKYQCYLMVFEYGLNRKEPETDDDVISSLFAMVKPLIDKSIVRYDNCKKNGKKGGNPNFAKGKKNPYYNEEDNQKDNQEHNQRDNLNVNVNDNYNVNDNVNVNVNVYVNDNEYVYSNELTHISNKFTKSFPTKNNTITKIAEINKIDLSTIAIEQLISKIEESDFLITRNNLGLEWCLINYSKIINNEYEDYAKKTAKNEPNNANSFTNSLEAVAKHLESLGD